MIKIEQAIIIDVDLFPMTNLLSTQILKPLNLIYHFKMFLDYTIANPVLKASIEKKYKKLSKMSYMGIINIILNGRFCLLRIWDNFKRRQR